MSIENIQRPLAGPRTLASDFGGVYLANAIVAFIFAASGPVAIILSVGARGGLQESDISSWIFGAFFVNSVISLLFCWLYRQPLVFFWTIPGAVLVGPALGHLSFAEVIGAFWVTGLLMGILGFTGWVRRAMQAVPMPIVMGMVAGVFLRFGLDLVYSIRDDFMLAAPMTLAFLALTALPRVSRVLPPVVGALVVGAAVIAATGLAASEIWRLRTGRAQAVAVDVRAAIAAFRSERYLRVNGGPAPDGRSPLFGFYLTADGRWIQIHANMPHHHAGHVRFMGCEETRESMAAAVAKWKAQDLEDALNAAGLPAGMVRPKEEWLAHPHARAVAELPLLEIVRIGESAPEPFGAGDRPLSGVRVLDLTRVIAGAEGGRTLASHGADVLLVAGDSGVQALKR